MHKILFRCIIYLSLCSCDSPKKNIKIEGVYQSKFGRLSESIQLVEGNKFHHTLQDLDKGITVFTESGTFQLNDGLIKFSNFMQFYDPMTGRMSKKGDLFISYKMHFLISDRYQLIKPSLDQEYFFKAIP